VLTDAVDVNWIAPHRLGPREIPVHTRCFFATMKSRVLASSICVIQLCIALGSSAIAQDRVPALEEAKETGVLRSSYRAQTPRPVANEAPRVNVKTFRAEIEPLLRKTCFQCHGPETEQGTFRVDTLDPDLIQGIDAAWWLEVLDVLSNSEMPPEGEGIILPDEHTCSFRIRIQLIPSLSQLPADPRGRPQHGLSARPVRQIWRSSQRNTAAQ